MPIDSIFMCSHRYNHQYLYFYYFLFLILIFLAILICLEHSFWLTQQGSSPTEGFVAALDIYLRDKHVLLDQRVEDYLMSKGINDWFTTKHKPSDDERLEFKIIVLDNLLRKASSCLL